MESTKDFSTSKNLPKYFNYFPSKTIDVGEDLMFDFIAENHNPNVMGRATADLITLEPAVDFKATWTTPTTLKITPEIPLKYDKHYNVKVKLGSLFKGVPLSEKNILFKLKTQALNFEVKEPTLAFSRVIGDESIEVVGRILHPIGFDTLKIKKSFQFHQDNNKHLRIDWDMISHKELEYRVSELIRLDKDSTALSIQWNGYDLNPSFKGSHYIKIPKRDDFTVTDIVATDESDKKIEIYFSNIVKYNQVLDGLFTVKNHPVKFKTEIESNKVTLVPEEGLPQDIFLMVNKNILDKTSRAMKDNHSLQLHFSTPKPDVKDLRVGVIIPDADKILVPFEAKNLRYVDINVRKIFQNNVIHFLRHHDLESNYRVRHVGRTVYKEKIDLNKFSKESNIHKFVNYSIDLKNMADKDPGCIYKINITFKPSYVRKKDCEIGDVQENEESDDDEDVVYEEEEDYDYYYHSSERSSPCEHDYYTQHFIEKTVLLSNIGVIAKAHEKSLNIICSDINTAAPLANAEVEIYDQQKQIIFKNRTNYEGQIIHTALPRAAKFIIVKKNRNYSYLDLGNQSSNSMTEFDVEGIKKSTGLDAFIYTERGVYRPGDSIYLNTIVVDGKKALPQSHPLHIVVTDAQGHVKFDKNITQKKGNIYSCVIPTLYNDVTGNWNVNVSVGNANFNHTLKIETIKPNRLKIAYDKFDDIIDISNKSMSLMNFKSRWLHGASAQDLKAEVDVKISDTDTKFSTYSNYLFNDPLRKIDGTYDRVFDGKLNDEGKATYKINMGVDAKPAGFVKLNIKSRVFEKSGNFSEDYLTVTASPYSSYVGLKIPKDKWDNNYIKSNAKINIPFICLDKDGKKMANKKLSFGLYTAKPSWWYEENNDNSLRYNSDEHLGSVEKRELNTNQNGEASWSSVIRNEGYYFVRICDEESGHCSGGNFYVSSYEKMQTNTTTNILDITCDKKSYANGELIKLKVPSNANAKILVSLENAKGVLQTMWVDGKQGFTDIAIPATAQMHPNVYIHTTLIQSYRDKSNDLPMRMYGIIPVKVLDPKTVLEPVISMPSSLEPDKEYNINVKEKYNRPFTYTLAVVDEGLLDVTRFKTPDPHKHFFAKQALNVRTWDIYDQIAATFNGKVYKTISIGGDGAIDNAALAKRAERFKPVVKFYGPFFSKGGSRNHKIKISNYVGSVRAMVVACNDQSYGHAEIAVPVKKPLMVQSTLPRVLYIGDEFTFATNVFAMNKGMKKIEINVEATPNVSFITSKNATISLGEGSNDDIAEFKLKANKIGTCSIKVTAQSGSITTTEKLEIAIINPNPIEYAEVKTTVNKSEKLSFETFGIEGSNKAVLEVGNLISFNCEKRMQYLIQYPYGCLEQTTSSAFPQLYVGQLINLDDNQKKEIANNIKGGIERLSGFQTYSGAFAYWPGQSEINNYANTYVGHFLIEARTNGFNVPNLMLKNWLEYQTKASNNYQESNDYDNNYDQAYRLYTLALAGTPNKGAMNVLKLKTNLDEKTKNMLACAYALTDVKQTALDLFNQVSVKNKFNQNTYTFNSDLVNLSIKSMTMDILGLNKESQVIKTELVNYLASERWYNTHTLALAMMAISKQNSSATKEGVIASYVYNGKTYKINTSKPMVLIELPIGEKRVNSISFMNSTNRTLFAKVTYSGSRPLKADTKNFADNLMMNVEYYGQDNNRIDVCNLPQGKDFYALIKLKKTNKNLSYANLSLDYFIPTGWEIQNDRLSGQGDGKRYDYQDIRDHVMYTFFNLNNEVESFKIKLTASYKGRYFLPATLSGAMYDYGIKASNSGQWVTVSNAEKNEAIVCE
jgi:alpha-2-macroglobulin